jgi:hypothetical protein
VCVCVCVYAGFLIVCGRGVFVSVVKCIYALRLSPHSLSLTHSHTHVQVTYFELNTVSTTDLCAAISFETYDQIWLWDMSDDNNDNK